MGFDGTCTEENIKINIKNERSWCKKSRCKEYYDSNFSGRPPIKPCYESRLFTDWQFGAGGYHSGKRAGTPIHLSKDVTGKIAILTTRFPDSSEKDRKIIGFFKIASMAEEPETIVKADKAFRLRLTMEDALVLNFWNYYSTGNGVRWGHGLFRYLTDKQVAQILMDIKEIVRDEKTKKMIKNLLSDDYPGIVLHPKRKILTEVLKNRKYGPGGESAGHKKLKMWIKAHPEAIGIQNVQKSQTEYRFPSWDAADVYFELSGNRYVVVEIKTSDPFTGWYQALKYRVLKCAELGISISSPRVEAVFVAWNIPDEIKEVCARYGIRCVEKKV